MTEKEKVLMGGRILFDLRTKCSNLVLFVKEQQKNLLTKDAKKERVHYNFCMLW